MSGSSVEKLLHCMQTLRQPTDEPLPGPFVLNVLAISISPFLMFVRLDRAPQRQNAILRIRAFSACVSTDQRRTKIMLQHTQRSQSPEPWMAMSLLHRRRILDRAPRSSPPLARRSSRRPQGRTTSRVERRHSGREPTGGREREIRRGASSSSTRGRERQATGRWERQTTSAARRGDWHGRQVGRATGTGRRRERREGLVRAGAHGWREGEVARRWWRTRCRGGGGCCSGSTWQGREAWRRDTPREGRREGHAGWWEAAAAGLVLGQHGVVVGLALGGVGGGDGVDD